MKLPVYSGGSRALIIAVVVGVIGLGLTAVRGFVGGARLALFSYLIAFAYWLGLGLGALVLLMIFHAAKGRWMVVVRRLVEVMAGALAIFPILFIPIALGIDKLYPWAGSTAGLDEESLHLIAHRAPYLNPRFFLVRAALYFSVWILFSQLFLRWSTRQDAGDAPQLTRNAWTLGAGGLPAVGITLTFAAVDWLMSLGVHWFSSMWGVYYFAGSFVGAIALLIILSLVLSRSPSLEGALKTAHWLSLGKFLLAFTCFWAYVAFSQYMLVWIANLPDTIPFLLLREKSWSVLGWLLIGGHFAVPFLILLGRAVKMHPSRLALVAGWILLMHYLDLYWVVMPQLRPGEVLLDWSNLSAFAGIGGVSLAFGIWLLRGRHALPVGDPFLEESLSYAKMM